MKKTGLLGLTVVCSVAIFTACGGQQQSVDNSQTSAVEVEDDTFMKDLEESNKIMSLIDKYGKVFYESKQIVKDGEEFEWSYYRDNDRFVFDSYYCSYIVEGNDVYGMNYEANCPYRGLFIGDEYERLMADIEIESIYEYFEEEEITSKKEKDGMIYLETKMSQEPFEGYYAGFGYAKEEVDYSAVEYVIDADTLEIFEITSYFVVGGEKVLYEYVKFNNECEEYVPDKELVDTVFGSDTRTVTVVVDAGTADEKTYSQTCGKGCAIQSYYPLEEFEYITYKDKECTEVAGADLTVDSIIYLKRIEK